MKEYVGYKVKIPVDMWKSLYDIAIQEWDPEDRKLQIEIAAPGIEPSAPVNPIIVKLLQYALEKRK